MFHFSAHQRLLVLHQPHDLHRLLLQLVLQVVWQRRQHGVKVLLSHGVVHGQDGLMGGERASEGVGLKEHRLLLQDC